MADNMRFGLNMGLLQGDKRVVAEPTSFYQPIVQEEHRSKCNVSSGRQHQRLPRLTYSIRPTTLRTQGGRADKGLKLWEVIVIDTQDMDMVEQEVCLVRSHDMAKLVAGHLQDYSKQGGNNDKR